MTPTFLVVRICSLDQMALPAHVRQLYMQIKFAGKVASTSAKTPTPENLKYSGATFNQRLFLDCSDAALVPGENVYFALLSPTATIPLAKFTLKLDTQLLSGRPITSSVPLFVETSEDKWVKSDAILHFTLCKSHDLNVDLDANAVAATSSVPTRVLNHTFGANRPKSVGGQYEVGRQPSVRQDRPPSRTLTETSLPPHGAGCVCRYCVRSFRASSAKPYFSEASVQPSAIAVRDVLVAENMVLRQQLHNLSLLRSRSSVRGPDWNGSHRPVYQPLPYVGKRY